MENKEKYSKMVGGIGGKMKGKCDENIKSNF